ncbi:hypothetical protein RZS08_60130, partial [Arthrospira platensis SPKY1]|nr:hypothetical protein [Arthrospira platensis SPKY1]
MRKGARPMITLGKEKNIRSSRIGRNPIRVPADVELAINGQQVAVKGKKGAAELAVHPWVVVD